MSAQDTEEILQEMYRQLRTASRIISNLKLKVEELSVQNNQLLSKNHFLEKPTTRKDDVGQQSENVLGIDANKKIRLAQDQMAKVMATDRREIQEWISKCKILEQKLEKSKVRIAQKFLDSALFYLNFNETFRMNLLKEKPIIGRNPRTIAARFRISTKR
jgi:hypothetical protein